MNTAGISDHSVESLHVLHITDFFLRVDLMEESVDSEQDDGRYVGVLGQNILQVDDGQLKTVRSVEVDDEESGEGGLHCLPLSD